MILLLCASVILYATAAGAKTLAKLEFFPASVSLETNSDFQSFVVLATYADDTTEDVTAKAKCSFGDPGLAKLQKNILFPITDGSTEMQVVFQNKTVRVPVKVQDAKAERDISFRLDVMPVFRRAGCNSGSCHGSSQGQDGFRLSLFGYDPEGDYYRITRQISSRRLNLALPDESLMIEKALGRVQHTGGKVIEKDSPYHKAFYRWLKNGAKNDPKDIPKPVSLELMPASLVMEGPQSKQQLIALARYSDGTSRDVTLLTVFK
ncbi:MAG: cell surface protein, partial [Planctomycetes bacterium]|nr:cell surface protein [Planctomycetota bacterium]